MPTVIHGRNLVTDPFLVISHCLGPELFDGDEDSDSITDFFNAHLLEDLLITFDQIVAGDIIHPEKLFILGTVYASQPLGHPFLVPGTVYSCQRSGRERMCLPAWSTTLTARSLILPGLPRTLTR